VIGDQETARIFDDAVCSESHDFFTLEAEDDIRCLELDLIEN
jgi:hypothetical protein